jgi:hypothetical protein
MHVLWKMFGLQINVRKSAQNNDHSLKDGSASVYFGLALIAAVAVA